MRDTTRSHRGARGRTRLTAAGLAALLGTSLLAGCADDSGSGSEDGQVTVTIGVFGVFGYKQAGLYDEYEKLHPNVTIKETSTQNLKNYFPALLTHLSSGSGLQDIQAVEVNNIAQINQLADKFVDLSEAPGAKKDDFLPWKWNQATTEDGKTIGLGTDIGPLAICYRKDLFEQAGLPTDREEVGELWAGDWNKYLETGERYMADAPEGTAFVDSAGALFNGSISGSPVRYYNENGEPIYKNSPGVKQAWELAMDAIEGKMTARITQFEKPWQQALSNGTFATTVCPAWMLGQIKEYAGEKNAEQWDVAAAPKPGNWGGSFLTVPTASQNREEAMKLAAWLTAPEQQAKLFAAQAQFPSSRAAYELDEVKNHTDEYFSGAPVGPIFSEAAENVPNLVLGPKDQVIGETLVNVGIAQVEQQGKSPQQGWDAATSSIDNALDE